tara:strand:- start:137216 stop:138091 length:876 start_codon:yes stop_codon:yes gene_type:complete
MNKLISKSRIIAGTMSWGSWGKNLNENEIADLIINFCQAGITAFDHADIYGGYTTELEFGKAFKKLHINRSNVKFITKCGIMYPCNKNNFKVKHYDYSAKNIRKSIENSLNNLNTEYIDVFLLHRPSPLMKVEEIGDVISELKEEKKIISFGVSNFSENQINLLEKTTDIDWNQIELSITNNSPFTNGLVDYLNQKNIGIMAWSPLGDFFKNRSLSNRALSELLEILNKKYSSTNDQLLLSWLMKHPSKIFPVIGTTNYERINLAADSENIELEITDWFLMYEKINGKRVP